MSADIGILRGLASDAEHFLRMAEIHPIALAGLLDRLEAAERERDELLVQLNNARDKYRGMVEQCQEFDIQTGVLSHRLIKARQERDELRGALSSFVNEIPHRESRHGNAPGHGHSVPGIWDSDNGALAGKPCGWCAVWAAAERLTKEPAND